MPESTEAPVPPQPSVPTWRDRMELVAGGGLPPPPVRVALGAGGLLALVLVAWLLLREPAPPLEASIPVADPAATSTTASPEVVAHAAGAVVRPGLYRLAKGSRIDDLLRLAGGPLEDADLDRVNLAAPVTDGSRVHLPRRGEPGAVVDDGSGGTTATGPLDLNTATAEQLEELPGVGPSTAAAIVAERARRGRFRSVDDLLDVRGIGPAKLDAIRELVTV